MVAENVVLKFSIACSRSRPPFHPTRSTPSNTPSLLQPSMHNVPLKRAGCAVTSTAAWCLSIVCVLDMLATACTTLFRPASPQGGIWDLRSTMHVHAKCMHPRLDIRSLPYNACLPQLCYTVILQQNGPESALTAPEVFKMAQTP